MTVYYKFLAEGARGPYSNRTWAAPKGARPGRWMPEQPVVLCQSGYHLTTLEHAVGWIDTELYVAEGRGVTVVDDTKVVFGQARLLRRVDGWNERTQRLFAADCAERVLPIFEKAYPGDGRPRAAIEAARAAADAAWAATEASAWEAAARAAARDAAEDAAWAADAAGKAAWAAAWAADAAAWAAAKAAGVAAWAAADAAWAAAKASAWEAAARAAARDAERKWQTERLAHYIGANE